MKALTIRQPYPWLILHGYKTVENRTWSTSHRGTLLIHAGATIEKDIIRAVLESAQADGAPLTSAEIAELHITGALVGIVEVVDCTLTPAGDDVYWHTPGTWAWVLRNPRLFIPAIPATGKLGLWTPDTLTLVKVQAAIWQELV